MGRVVAVPIVDAYRDIRHPIKGLKVLTGRESEKTIAEKVKEALSKPKASRTHKLASH